MENIIFDIGNVLLEFEPESYLTKKYGQERCIEIMTIIFASTYWDLLDTGERTTKEVIELLSRENVEYQDEIAHVLMHWAELMIPIEENILLLKDLKEKGYNIYILSNFSEEAFLKLNEKFDFFKLFDGGVISYQLHQMKPAKILYDTLISKYNIDPSKSVFIDDMYANIEQAQNYGFDTIWMRYGVDLHEQLNKRNLL